MRLPKVLCVVFCRSPAAETSIKVSTLYFYPNDGKCPRRFPLLYILKNECFTICILFNPYSDCDEILVTIWAHIRYHFALSHKLSLL